MMPADETTDDIGAPELCRHHEAVIANLAAKDHVGDVESTRAAENIARQCRQCRRTP